MCVYRLSSIIARTMLCRAAVLSLVILQVFSKAAPQQDVVNYQGPARLENVLLGLLEDLRNTMINGSEDMPVLDPLQLEHIEINGEDFDIPGLSLKLLDFDLHNLSTFEVHYLSVRNWLIRYILNFDFSIPSMKARSREYDVALNIGGISVFGKGPASVQLINPRVTGSMTADVRIIGGFNIRITNCNIVFHLDGFKPEISGLFGNEAASDFANIFLEHLALDMVKVYKNEISEVLNRLIPEIANEFLRDVDLSDILG